MPSRRGILLALSVAVALSARARVTRAAETETETGAPRSTALRQEWVGVELTPVSMALASCCDEHGGSLDKFQAGPGGTLRLLRYRWEHAYVIPIQAGVYVSSGNATIFTHVQTEGGVIVPGTDRRLELGMGAGLGILAMKYAVQCDGSCILGGSGWLISFAARYLFLDGPRVTVGAGARVIIPVTDSRGTESWGYFTGGGNMILGALEIGFGRS